MSGYYNLDGVKTYLENTLDENETLLAAWEKISYNTKKDGKPFAALAKNFNNARIGSESYDLLGYEKRIYVCAWSKRNGSKMDDIKLWDYVEYMKDSKMLQKTENIIKGGYLGETEIYIYDIDDIKQAIRKRIEYLEEYCASLQKAIEKAEQVYNNFRAAYTAAMKTLENDTIEFKDHKTLYYAVRDTIKERYPYC